MASSPLHRLLPAALCVVFAAPGSAGAQVTGDVPVQQFQPTQAIPGAYNQLWGPDTLGHLRPSFGLWANYAARPLELQSYAADHEQVDLVRSHLELSVTAAVGLGERFQVGLAMPVTPFITQGDAVEGLATPPDIAGAGLGDLRIAGNARILGDGDGFDLAAAAIVSVPTGDEARYLGNAGITVEPKLIAGLNLGSDLDLAGNLGFVVRPAMQTMSFNGTPVIEVGHELTYGVGGRYALGDGGVQVMAELFGRVAFSDALDGSSIPLELDLSARSYLGEKKNHAVTFGAGTGLIGGYGSPVLRVFAGYAFAPAPRVDTDGDGIYDDDDGCVDDPEDFDEFEDMDGCPDADNDKDGILDGQDKCPNKAEDKDDFEDEDGCPDPDNDQDGVPDATDKCPNGLTDPTHMEDRDGFADDDGCLDPDNDKDGILDAVDKCPSEKETINGIDDEDGCPDEGKSDVEVTDTHINILQKVFFETNSDVIKGESFKVLNQVALTLKANEQITLVEVEGHTDDVSAADYNLDLSQRRADSVKRYLVDQGVAAKRLRPRGYGEERPLVKGTSKAARAKNRRVEFRIVEIDGKLMEGEAAEPPMGDEPAPQKPEEAAEPAPQKAEMAPEPAQKAEATEAMAAEPAKPTSAFSGEKKELKILVFFADGGAALDARGEQICQSVAAYLAENPKARVRLMGFTDETADKGADQAISEQRNQAVKACLVKAGVAAGRIELRAPGSKWPNQPNDSDAHRAENRRVRLMPINGKGEAIEMLPVELDVPLPSF